MSEKAKGMLNNRFRAFLLLVVVVAAVYLVVQNAGVFWKILLVMLGFGAVVLVHEFGHFIVAKLSDINVEAFSIGFPPVLAGIQRTEKGWRVRVLPGFFRKEGEDSGDGSLSFTIGTKSKAGETEYRIGLIPFGGFVKMLGQDDSKASEKSDDPRSYANKPVSVRIGVIAMGVTFNIISAVGIFIVAFLIGIKLAPAVVGGVRPGSPAALAGLKAGDEVIEIGGKSGDLDFSNIVVAGALSDANEAVGLKVRHEDGSVERFAVVAKKMPGLQMRVFGISQAQSLTIARVSDANALLESTGLLAGDYIERVGGQSVQRHWELERIVEESLVPEITVVARRKGELIESKIALEMAAANRNVESEADLGHIYGMVPRLRIIKVEPKSISLAHRLLRKIGIKRGTADEWPKLKEGDIILAVGDVENPTYKELRDITTESENKQLSIEVLRSDSDGSEEIVTVTVVPRERSGRVVIGIGVALDAEHPVVAKTISVADGSAPPAIRRGASITAVNEAGVSNFYDVINELKKNTGQRVTIDWRTDDGVAGGAAMEVGEREKSITVKSSFAEFVPFDSLERLYIADGPIDAVVMGCRKTVGSIAQMYATIKSLISRTVSPKNLMGPVGIVKLSYDVVAHRPLIYYVYLLGLINAWIAVFNFLPLLPLDGGHIALLLVEKVKGSAVSERIQGAIANVGWVLVGVLALYVTFNDIVRGFLS